MQFDYKIVDFRAFQLKIRLMFLFFSLSFGEYEIEFVFTQTCNTNAKTFVLFISEILHKLHFHHFFRENPI